MQVLAIGFWEFGGGIMPGQKLIGQITKCRIDGVLCYVRENLDGRMSFYISSGQRWAEKGGNYADRGPMANRQILELVAPSLEWDRITALVHRADRLKRPVRRNRTFTKLWAETQLWRSRGEVLPDT